MFSLKVAAHKVLGFLKVHGVDLVATFVGSLATLVMSGTTSTGNGAVLALVVAAILATAKQFKSPAWLVNFLTKVQAKVGTSNTSSK